MAHLWVENKETGWGAKRLDGAEFDLGSLVQPGSAAERAAEGDKMARVARLIRVDAGGTRVWALVASSNSNVRVNSRAVVGGLRVLGDRDAIGAGDGVRHFFSTETLATVEPFPGTERTTYCGRCRQPIEVGTPSVRCPGCEVWYHEDAARKLPCWTYAETCNFCPTKTALDAGFQWVPEE
jgi:hypothetical protein